MVKFWTIQNKDVKTIIEKDGIYQPDFKLSRWPLIEIGLGTLYDFVLRSYNIVNKTDLHGLIFAFTHYNGNQPQEIEDFDAFLKVMKNSMLNNFLSFLNNDNVSVFELKYNDDFNPLYIEYNNFQTIMPPIQMEWTSKEEIYRILRSIEKGIPTHSLHSCGIGQAHLPNIKLENIINIYDMNLYSGRI